MLFTHVNFVLLLTPARRRRFMDEMDPWVKHDKFGDIDGSPVGSHWNTRCAIFFKKL